MRSEAGIYFLCSKEARHLQTHKKYRKHLKRIWSWFWNHKSSHTRAPGDYGLLEKVTPLIRHQNMYERGYISESLLWICKRVWKMIWFHQTNHTDPNEDSCSAVTGVCVCWRTFNWSAMTDQKTLELFQRRWQTSHFVIWPRGLLENARSRSRCFVNSSIYAETEPRCESHSAVWLSRRRLRADFPPRSS